MDNNIFPEEEFEEYGVLPQGEGRQSGLIERSVVVKYRPARWQYTADRTRRWLWVDLREAHASDTEDGPKDMVTSWNTGQLREWASEEPYFVVRETLTREIEKVE